jgi:hypothetical protein
MKQTQLKIKISVTKDIKIFCLAPKSSQNIWIDQRFLQCVLLKPWVPKKFDNIKSFHRSLSQTTLPHCHSLGCSPFPAQLCVVPARQRLTAKAFTQGAGTVRNGVWGEGVAICWGAHRDAAQAVTK